MASDTTQLVTYKPDGSDPRLLGYEGAVTGLTYSFSLPGGCDQLSANLARTARYRSDVINPGRLVKAWRGSMVAWTGILDEPVPSGDGWNLTAHGAGTYGDDFLAIYSVAWGTGVFNDAVDQAITRGLDWVRSTDIGAVSGIWTGQKVDNGGQTITDLLNLGTHKGGLTWAVRTVARGNVLSVFAIPTTANRILISGEPEARSIAESPSTLYVRYQSAWDTNKTPATFALTSVTQTADETAHGRREDLIDLSSAGTMSSGSAQTVASNVFKRFTRVAFADAFEVQPGELLNPGGQHVDLGIYWADNITPMVCEMWLADYAYGGEVTGGPINVLVGHYEYDADAGTATITPFENARHDFGTLMGIAVDTTPVRVKPHRKHKPPRHHGHGHRHRHHHH